MPELSVAEADAFDALPWRERRRRILSGRDLKERLSRFEAAVYDSGIDPLEAYERFAGRRPRDLPAARAGKRDHRAAQRARAVGAPCGRGAARRSPRRWTASTIRLADVPAWLQALDVVERASGRAGRRACRALGTAVRGRCAHARPRREGRAPRARPARAPRRRCRAGAPSASCGWTGASRPIRSRPRCSRSISKGRRTRRSAWR